ncbi:MAG: NAD(P)-dependent oxidoreductase [Candidatus Andersenbacteria bacterium]
MTKQPTIKKLKKVVVLDTIFFYPEHRAVLEQLADEVIEYPSSLPESLERQYVDNPELFRNVRCYTELGANNSSLQLLMNRIDGADCVISCWTCIPDEILKLNPQLKLIVFWTHEKEHRLNLKLAEQFGITVTNIPDYGTDAVAEVVFAGLLEVLAKNYVTHTLPQNEESLALTVMHELLRRRRMLDRNEKYTRAGKFVHHFHKLGKITFDPGQRTLDELIPERLLARAGVALIGQQPYAHLRTWLRAFEVVVDELPVFDASKAEFYRTLARNDFVVISSNELDPKLVQKINLLAGVKVVDLAQLKTIDWSVAGKRFGVLGLGRIGSKVARVARDVGFEVQFAARVPAARSDHRHVSVSELLATSDVLSVHLPAHKADNFLSADKLALLKKGGIFINTADGNITDTAKLTELLSANHVLAYLDVYPGLPRKDVFGLPMEDKADWKLKAALPRHVLAYRAGWKTQESIRVKTFELLGHMVDYLTSHPHAH